MNCFVDVLNRLEISDNIDIDQVIYKENTNSILFCLISNTMIKAEKRDDIEHHIRQELPFLKDVEIQIRINNLDVAYVKEDIFKEYFPTIIWHARKTCPPLNGLLNQMHYVLDVKGDISLSNEVTKLQLFLPDTFAVDRLKEKKWETSIRDLIKKEINIVVSVELLCDIQRECEKCEDFEIQKSKRAEDEAKQQLQMSSSSSKSSKSVDKDYSNYSKKASSKSGATNQIYKKLITREVVTIKNNIEEECMVCYEGEIFQLDTIETKNGKIILNFALTDETYSIMCKLFLMSKEWESLSTKLKVGGMYKVEGLLRYDSYSRDVVLNVRNINEGKPKKQRMDNADEKRIELLAHTNMSDMNGICSVKDLVKQAATWGHEAIAITDFGGVQAFPDAMNAGVDNDIKIIYGMVANVYEDNGMIIEHPNDKPLTQAVVVFDIETTGLSFKYDKITEIGAVKVQNGQIVDTYSALINPEIPIPFEIVELTGITDDMVANKPTIDVVFPEFLKFIEDCPLVAHNANFDISFIKEQARKQDISFHPIVIDTLLLSRLLIKSRKRHSLGVIAKHLKVSLENHHRAVDDAMATAKIYIKFLNMLADKDIVTMAGINELGIKEFDYTNARTYTVSILVKTQEGLKNLYQLVSHSNTKTFYRIPRLSKTLLENNRQEFLLGSSTRDGKLFEAILSNKSDEELKNIIEFYDYIEIQPAQNNMHMLKSGEVKSIEELENMNLYLIELASKYNKPVIATGDIHFINPEDEIYRRIIASGKGNSNVRDKGDRPLYFRTTDEMLRSFSYLGEELAKKVVIDAPKELVRDIGELLPVPTQTFPPRIEGSDDELRQMCFKKARSIYGDDLPEIVETRLTKELDSIIKNGYSVMYIIAQKLVTKSLEDGYLVGSRGSVGSSFAATMSDITEVNPLTPHYVCPNCKKSEFITDGSYGSGYDLPNKNCPNCDIAYKKDGHDIPFATFLGFNGDKEPDIDLNFAGVYQATSHKYTEELFGEGYVYKAGTISTVADKTAFGFVKKYFEEVVHEDISYLETTRLAKGCTGIKRTTGQHPGGIMVIPDYKDVHDFTPIQYPANDTECGVLTTHFDYHSISGRILKLDILGHDVPTIIRDLEDLTGVNIDDVPLDDKAALSLFTSADALKLIDDDYMLDIGSLGVPEFGTPFVRQMLAETKPQTFSDLVRISGLSHGELVWVGNAQDLVRNNTVGIKDVISARDDIMVYLMYMGLEPLRAFTIMEKVRRGNGLTPEDEQLMKEHDVPSWYIWSCNQIKYMFPKAHAVAYVTMSFRVAYFKVHHPLAFYATYFGTKVTDFDAQLICQGKNMVYQKLNELKNNKEGRTKKEDDLFSILEIVAEMYARGFRFLKVDLYLSEASKFKIVDGAILPPFQSLQGVGETAAKGLANLKNQGEILSIEDMQTKAKLSKTVIEALREHGCLEGLSESNQLTLF